MKNKAREEMIFNLTEMSSNVYDIDYSIIRHKYSNAVRKVAIMVIAEYKYNSDELKSLELACIFNLKRDPFGQFKLSQIIDIAINQLNNSKSVVYLEPFTYNTLINICNATIKEHENRALLYKLNYSMF